MGVELRDRVFGAVGFGGIAQATAKLLAPFGMTELIAYDPFCKESVAKVYTLNLGLILTVSQAFSQFHVDPH